MNSTNSSPLCPRNYKYSQVCHIFADKHGREVHRCQPISSMCSFDENKTIVKDQTKSQSVQNQEMSTFLSRDAAMRNRQASRPPVFDTRDMGSLASNNMN